MQSEVLTVQKTSVLAAVEKQFGLVKLLSNFHIFIFIFVLEGGNFRLWWRSYNDNDNGVFRVVPNDTKSICEKTDNFIPFLLYQLHLNR